MLSSRVENARWAENNGHNALWHYRNSYNTKFHVMAVFKQPQRVVACEDMPWCEIRVVAVNGNNQSEFGSERCGSYSEDSEGFGLKVTCNLCVRKSRINIKGEGAKSGQGQAQKMGSLCNSRLQAVDNGTNVVVRAHDLVRGRLAPRNVPAVVVVVNSFWLCLLGEEEGLLSDCILAMSNCWRLHRGTWCVLKFTICLVILNDKV